MIVTALIFHNEPRLRRIIPSEENWLMIELAGWNSCKALGQFTSPQIPLVSGKQVIGWIISNLLLRYELIMMLDHSNLVREPTSYVFRLYQAVKMFLQSMSYKFVTLPWICLWFPWLQRQQFWRPGGLPFGVFLTHFNWKVRKLRDY